MSGDESMKESYRQGKDLYATMGVGVYKNTYWDNMEHKEDGSANPDGKKRRSNMKVLLLGMMYQMGAHSIATSLKMSLEEAQKIIDDFYAGFPKVKDWITKTQEDCKKLGYVEDYWGRRRRLPDILLPKYQVEDKSNKVNIEFNPILGCEGKYKASDNPSVAKYKALLEDVKNKRDIDALKDKALKENIEIKDNSYFVAQAERQCVNARIQGGAATLTKLAMIKIHRDSKLRELGFRLNIAVHDELIGECPIENSEECSKRLCEMMILAAKENGVDVPMKCDPTVEENWYFEDYTNTMMKEYKSYVEELDGDTLRAMNKIKEEHIEASDRFLSKIFS